MFSVGWGCELSVPAIFVYSSFNIVSRPASPTSKASPLSVTPSHSADYPARAEFTFWLFLQNQGPTTRLWFESAEFRFWLWGTLLAPSENLIADCAVPGTLFALMGMPLTTFISRRQLDSVTTTFFFP